MVKMPTAHGVVQGYDAQMMVDSRHQVIVAAEAFSTQDHENLEPLVQGAKKNLGAIGKGVDYLVGNWKISGWMRSGGCGSVRRGRN